MPSRLPFLFLFAEKGQLSLALSLPLVLLSCACLLPCPASPPCPLSLPVVPASALRLFVLFWGVWLSLCQLVLSHIQSFCAPILGSG